MTEDGSQVYNTEQGEKFRVFFQCAGKMKYFTKKRIEFLVIILFHG